MDGLGFPFTFQDMLKKYIKRFLKLIILNEIFTFRKEILMILHTISLMVVSGRSLLLLIQLSDLKYFFEG